MTAKRAFCMGKFRVKWPKTGSFPAHIPVLLTIGSALPLPQNTSFYSLIQYMERDPRIKTTSEFSHFT